MKRKYKLTMVQQVTHCFEIEAVSERTARLIAENRKVYASQVKKLGTKFGVLKVASVQTAGGGTGGKAPKGAA